MHTTAPRMSACATPDRLASYTYSITPLTTCFCAPRPAGCCRLAATERAAIGQQHRAFEHEASPYLPAIDARPTYAQVRPLGDSPGTPPPDPPGSLVFGAAQQTPDALKTHDKHQASERSQPRYDPGHQMVERRQTARYRLLRAHPRAPTTMNANCSRDSQLTLQLTVGN